MEQKTTTDKLRMGTLFSGLGCPEAAVQTTPRLRERIEPVFYSELPGRAGEDGKLARNARCACAVLRHHMPGLPNLEDVRTAAPPPADIVVHGGMCTPFSGANRHHSGRLDPLSLLPIDAMEVCRRAGAKYFIFENTDALLVGTHGEYLKRLVDYFEDGHGYSCAYGALDTGMFGEDYPVARRRLWMVGALGRPDIAKTINAMWPKESKPSDPGRIDWSRYLTPSIDDPLMLKPERARKMLDRHLAKASWALHPTLHIAFMNATGRGTRSTNPPSRVEPIFWKEDTKGIRWCEGFCPTLEKSSWGTIGIIQWCGESPIARSLSGKEWASLMELPESWLDVPDPDDTSKMLDDGSMARLVGNSMHLAQPRWILNALLDAIDQCPLWTTSKSV